LLKKNKKGKKLCQTILISSPKGGLKSRDFWLVEKLVENFEQPKF